MSRRRPSRGRSATSIATQVVALAVLAISVLAGGAEAGTPSGSATPDDGARSTSGTGSTGDVEVRQGFPAEAVAAVPFAETDDPLAIGAIFKQPVSSVDAPTIVVQFREGFDLPTNGRYRVSVSVGDPTGRRLRSSLLADGGRITGRVEVGDGGSFEQSSPVAPPTFHESGLVSILVPVHEAPAGGAIWAEAELTATDGYSITPYFSLGGVLGTSSDGKVTSAPFGRVSEADGGPSTETATMPAGPSLSVDGNTIRLETSTSAPTEILGTEVREAVDYISIAPNYQNQAVAPDLIRLDRTSGTIELLDGLDDPPIDSSGAEDWLVQGFGDDPMGAGRLEFALGAVGEALGFDAQAEPPALGVWREFELADGKRVIADAVLVTVGWFDTQTVVSQTSTTVASVPAEDAEPGSDWLIPAVAAGVALLLIAASVIVMIRRRRGGAGDAADLLVAMAEEAEEVRRTKEHKAVSVAGDAGRHGDGDGDGRGHGDGDAATSDEDGGGAAAGAGSASRGDGGSSDEPQPGTPAAVRTGEVPIVPGVEPIIEEAEVSGTAALAESKAAGKPVRDTPGGAVEETPGGPGDGGAGDAGTEPMASGEPADGKPADGDGDGKPADRKPGDAKPADGDGDGKPADGKPGDGDGDGKPADGKPGDGDGDGDGDEGDSDGDGDGGERETGASSVDDRSDERSGRFSALDDDLDDLSARLAALDQDPDGPS